MSTVKNNLLFLTPDNEPFAEVMVSDMALIELSNQMKGQWREVEGRLTYVLTEGYIYRAPGIHAVELLLYKGSKIQVKQ